MALSSHHHAGRPHAETRPRSENAIHRESGPVRGRGSRGTIAPVATVAATQNLLPSWACELIRDEVSGRLAEGRAIRGGCNNFISSHESCIAFRPLRTSRTRRPGRAALIPGDLRLDRRAVPD